MTTNSPTFLRSKKEIINFLKLKDRDELIELLRLAADGAGDAFNHTSDQKERGYYLHLRTNLHKFLGDAK